MPRQTVFVVVERALTYNDCFYDFSGEEKVVKAFRTRERAEAVAHDLSSRDDRPLDPECGTDQSHVVLEAVVNVD